MIKDVQDKEYKYTKEKFKEKINFIDFEVRNYFSKRVIMSILKCIYTFNYYSIRDTIINKRTVETECLRYSTRKT